MTKYIYLFVDKSFDIENTKTWRIIKDNEKRDIIQLAKMCKLKQIQKLETINPTKPSIWNEIICYGKNTGPSKTLSKYGAEVSKKLGFLSIHCIYSTCVYEFATNYNYQQSDINNLFTNTISSPCMLNDSSYEPLMQSDVEELDFESYIEGSDVEDDDIGCKGI